MLVDVFHFRLFIFAKKQGKKEKNLKKTKVDFSRYS